MLKKMKFTNFKSWKEANIDCARITGVFGTNSSGKTSLIQFLLLLKQTKDATDRALTLQLNGEHVSLGSIKDAIYQHDEDLTLKWLLRFALDGELAVTDANRKKSAVVTKGTELSVGATVSVQNRAPTADRLFYGLGDLKFVMSRKKEHASQFDLTCTAKNGEDSRFNFVRTKGRAWQLPGPVKSYAFPDQARTYFQNAGFLADLEAAYEAQLDRIYYLGPMRESPERDYLWSRSKPSDVGRAGEKTMDAILAATEANEMRNLRPKAHLKTFQEMIAYWLREMGLIHEFRVEEIAPDSNRWQARVKTRQNSSWVLLTDVGFGISQVLPVVTLLQYVPEGSTVLLEQPEIHLHPLAQAALADVIIQAAIHRNVQVILESHSEHLLLRLQRRLAEEALDRDSIELYFCDAPDGYSVITKLDVDLLGNIKNWPDKFMGDAFNEAASAEMARLKRMKAAK
ncbi:AAA family ATPase [Agrobacterium sp. 22-226-1]